MCGIVGIKALSEQGKGFLPFVKQATDTLIKRGPDREGIFFHESVALGHRRLSIIDTSDKASQPMTEDSGRYTIVFNGEIFNYKVLKKELETKGMEFVSESDTEVLLKLFALEGELCLKRLNGEFVFVIYDKLNDSLFLARDRYGIKPLYYYGDEHKFIFASELKAILAFGIPKEIDTQSLQIYFHLNYIPSPYTIFNRVSKLLPAHYGFFRNSSFQTSAYYELHHNKVNTKLPYDTAKQKLHELIEESVQQRLVADVPLGCFLSGGVDSSIISLLAARHSKNLKTFSIGFRDEPYFDETRYSTMVAKKINSEHHIFSLTNDDIFACLHSVLNTIDEPFADSSALALFILSMYTRKYVTVALSGDGADELFGGYNKHAAEQRARKVNVITNLLPLAKPILNVLPKSRNSKVGNTIRQLQKFTEGISLNEQERYWKWAGFTQQNELSKLFRLGTDRYEARKSEIINMIDKDFNSVLLADMKLVLEGDMLVKVDRMSMANSLEVRVPFLDSHIVDFAFSLPAEFKILDSQSKRILKDAFKKELPSEIITRAKSGFEVPLLKWFRTELKGMIVNDLLSKHFVEKQGVFNYNEINTILKKLFSNNPEDSVARVWSLIVFQYWWKKYYA